MIDHLKKNHKRFDAAVVNGEGKYKRIFIRNRSPQV